MKTILKACAPGIIFSLLFLCSCAAIHPRLPADVPMNLDAAHGNGLMVTLRLKSGEPLLFAVDTCAPCTILDQSLEPKLGHRFDTVPEFEQLRDSKQTGGVSLAPLLYTGEAPVKITNYIMWGAKERCGLYLAPTLYLSDTPLMMDRGNGILTCDLKSVAPPGKPRVMGILGLDILDHYCIQLDFEAGKIRFLNPRQLNAADLGKAFPISYYLEDTGLGGLVHPFIQQPGLLGGATTDVFIDTGLGIDGTVDPELFQRATVQEGNAADNGRVRFGKCIWNGGTYTNLLIGPGGGAFENGKNPNFIGLRFLARHLVTFDFPHHMLYLKQTSAGPLESR